MNISILILNDCPWYFFLAYIYTFLTDSQLLLPFFKLFIQHTAFFCYLILKGISVRRRKAFNSALAWSNSFEFRK